MGKGDQRTKRGKIWRGSYGKLRPKEPKAKQPLQPPAKQSPQPPAKSPAR